MDKDYFQSDEFKDILNAYERQKGKKKSFYLDADDFADIADYYLSVDQPSKAMEAVEQGLAIHADDDILLIVKSATLIYQQMYDEAEKLLKTLDEEDPDVQYQLAQIQYAKYHHISKAERIWRKWLYADSENDDSEERKRENYIHIISSLVELDYIDERTGEKTTDMEAIRRWIREYIDKFQPLGKYEADIQLVDICRENELADLMSDVLSQVLEERPYHPKGWANLALAYFVQNKYEKALEACDFALAVDPNDIETLLTKAHTLSAMGEKGASKPIFKEYLEKGGEAIQVIPYVESLLQDGDKDEALYQLSWLSSYFEGQRLQMEKKQLEQGHVHDKKSKLFSKTKINEFFDLYQKIHMDIGDLYYRYGYFEKSVQAYRRVIEISPKCAEAYFMLGLNHLDLRRYDEASQSFASALTWTDDQVMMGIDIALSFMLKNNDKFALEILDAVTNLSANSKSPYVRNILAAKSLVYLKLGNKNQFLRSFRIACLENPDLMYKVYVSLFPKKLPFSQWYDYAEQEMGTLMNKIRKEDLFFTGFS